MKNIEKEKFLNVVKNNKFGINPPTIRIRSILSLGKVLIAVIVVGIASFAAYYTQKPKEVQTPKAEEEQKVEEQLPEFVGNELLIKVKKEAKGKIKEDPNNTGISSLNTIFKEAKVKKFEQIAKETDKSLKGHELFQWYLIEMEGPKENVVAKLDEVTHKLTSPTPNDKEQRMMHTDQAVFVIQGVIDRLSQDPNIETVEPNYMVKTQLTPNDPYYPTQGAWGQNYKDMWGLHNINAQGAWDQTTGSENIIVAVIDTGVDRNHPDLSSNMWVNTDEIQGNNTDDDNNGYIDDYYGWDWVNNDNDPMDDHGHGTHCSGTIGAVGNNSLGVVGVNWKTKIMALKFLNYQGGGTTYGGIKALQYAADNGAKVSSNSWGGGVFVQALDDAVKYEHDRGMVMVAAAGNNNFDALGFSPASSQYAITVAASNYLDQKASFSNWGEKIDVAAPGVNILSLKASQNNMCTTSGGNIIGNDYCVVSGTSMATPHVAGLAALLLAKNPNLANEEVRQIIRQGADDLGTPGKDKDFGFGRINASSSLSLSNTNPLTPSITSPTSRIIVASPKLTIVGNASGATFVKYTLELGKGRTPSSWTLIKESTTPVTNGTLGELDIFTLEDDSYTIRLIVEDTNGRKYQAQVYDITIDNFEVLLSILPTTSKGVVDIYGSAVIKNLLTFDHYIIEWGLGTAPTTWNTSGIVLSNNGRQPVINSILGTVDTSTFADNQIYSIRLTAVATNGLQNTVTKTTKVDPYLVKGWPLVFPKKDSCASNFEFSPVFSDIDNNGEMEIIITNNKDKLFAYRKDASVVPGFPVIFAGPDERGYYNGCTPSVNVDDLDNDGIKEIVFTGAGLYVVQSNGEYKFPPIKTYNSAFGYDNITPSIADINNDGNKELVFIEGTWQYNQDKHSYDTQFTLHALDYRGSEIAGFPKVIIDNINITHINWGVVHISDLDKDGNNEIAWSVENSIYLFDNNGNILPGWPFKVPNINNGQTWLIYSGTLSSGDIDGDGKLELTAINNSHCTVGMYCGSGGSGEIAALYVWKKDGTVLSNFPVINGLSDSVYTRNISPSVTDFDGDGKDEIVVMGGVVNSQGQIINRYVASASSFSIADVDGDSVYELISPFHNSIIVKKYLSSSDLNIFGGIYGFITTPVVGDIDNDGRLEIASSSVGFNDPFSALYLWSLPYQTQVNENNSWPMFGHDPQRTGRIAALGTVPPPSSGTPVPVPITPTPIPTRTPTIVPTPTRTSSPTPTRTPTIAPTPTRTPSPTQPPVTKATLTGSIRNAVMQTIISGAKVDVKNTSGGKATSVYTNSQGIYTIQVNPGSYTATANASGYQRLVKTTTVTSGTLTTLNFEMIPKKPGAAGAIQTISDFFANLLGI